MQVLYLELAARWLSWRAESVKKNYSVLKKYSTQKKTFKCVLGFKILLQGIQWYSRILITIYDFENITVWYLD